MYVSEFITIAIAHLFAVASPGPDFAIVLRQSVTQGKYAGLWTSVGISAGILLHVTYCVLGIGLLLAGSVALFTSVKLVGAVYLSFLGIQAIRASFRTVSYGIEEEVSQPVSRRSLVLSGFLTNGLNPKATLFFLALFSVVIDADTPVLVQAGYGVYLALATFAWFAMLSFILGLEPVRQFLFKAGHWFERLMGMILIALGIQLAFSLAPM